MEVSLAFPQVLFHEKLENFTSFKDDLIASVYKLKDSSRGRSASNRGGGWQSEDSPVEFKQFVEDLVQSMEIFVNCRVENWWVNVNPVSYTHLTLPTKA